MNVENHLKALQVEEAAEGQRTDEVREHLARCKACRARVAHAARYERVLRSLPRVEPAPDLAPQIRAALADCSRNGIRERVCGVGEEPPLNFERFRAPLV